MSDFFQPDVPVGYLRSIFKVMALASWHQFQVLTKRPERMQSLLTSELTDVAAARNVWLGVSVEDKKHGVPRIQFLRDTPAKIRFLSIEPLLEDVGVLELSAIDWAIVGGGPNDVLAALFLDHRAKTKFSKPSDYLIVNEDGKIIAERLIRTIHSRVCKLCELKPIRVHDLRHTYASHYVMNGGAIAELQMLLGHSLRQTCWLLRVDWGLSKPLPSSSEPARHSFARPCRRKNMSEKLESLLLKDGFFKFLDSIF